ncbi:MAG: hypothetical protein GTN71_09385 [Anaerolineae bacterium]|nr:hypothetical protein [Anaerolineae bacterium]
MRIDYVLALVGLLAMYVAGLYSRPLLFGADKDTSAGNDIVQTDAPACDEPALDSDLSIVQAYQALAKEMSNLNNGNYTVPEMEARLVTLEQEVRQLRVLNPYYRFKEIRAEVIPTGVPDTYGAVLNASLDQVQASIDVMKNFDPTYGEDKIVLEGTDLERYTRVGSATACQYCCSARTLVKPDGVAACGCAHSQAMRGLAAYLIINHPNDYTDGELVEELNRWRAVFFPKQTLTEALTARRDANEPGIEEIWREFPEFMPQMVGDC